MADWHLPLRCREFSCGLREWYARIAIPHAEPLQSRLPGALACQHQDRWRISVHVRAAVHGSRNWKHSVLPAEYVPNGHRLRVLREPARKLSRTHIEYERN